MDGSAAERHMIDGMRQTVKETTLRNRKLKISHQRSSTGPAKDGDDPISLPPATSISSHDLGVASAASDSFVTDPADDELPAVQQQLGGHEPPLRPDELRQFEAELLMHYLDVVFPLQFPFYRPTACEGGRGWLLAILTQTKPLYHAALSIAAYHRHFQLYYGTNEERRYCLPVCGKLDGLERQYTLALEGLRHHLQIFERNDGAMTVANWVEIIACVALLISLEV